MSYGRFAGPGDGSPGLSHSRPPRWSRWAALALLVTGMALDLAWQPALAGGTSTPLRASVAFELYGSHVLEQTFVASGTRLGQIAVVAAVDERVPGQHVVLRLREEETGRELRTAAIPVSTVPAGSLWRFTPPQRSSRWTRFTFAPVDTVPGKRYVFTLHAPQSSKEQAVHIALQFYSVYPEGRLVVNGREENGNILFASAYRAPLTVALLSQRLAGVGSLPAAALVFLCILSAKAASLPDARRLWSSERAAHVRRTVSAMAPGLGAAALALVVVEHTAVLAPWLVDQVALALAHRHEGKAGRLAARWGSTFTVAELARRITAEDAIVMVPPGAPPWGTPSRPFVFAYFLQPRRVVPEQRSLLDPQPAITHLLMVRGTPSARGGRAPAWPRFWVPVAAVIHEPVTRQVEVAAVSVDGLAGAAGLPEAGHLEWTPAAARLLDRIDPWPEAELAATILSSEGTVFQRIAVTYREMRPDYWGVAAPPGLRWSQGARLSLVARWPEGQEIAPAAGLRLPDGTIVAIEGTRLAGTGAWQTVTVDLAGHLADLPQAASAEVVWLGLNLYALPPLPYHAGWGVIALPQPGQPDPRPRSGEFWTARSWLQAGDYALVRGDPAEALRRYRLARALSPDDPAVFLALGEAARQAGDLAAAHQAAQAAITLAPDEPWAWYELGLLAEVQGRFLEAAAAYKRASDLAPEGAWAQLAAGHALEAAGKPDEALEYYRQAAALYPASEDAIEGFDALRRLEG